MFYSGQGFQLGGSSEAKTLSHPSSDDLKTGDSAEVHNIHNITKYDCAQRSITMKKNKLLPGVGVGGKSNLVFFWENQTFLVVTTTLENHTFLDCGEVYFVCDNSPAKS